MNHVFNIDRKKGFSKYHNMLIVRNWKAGKRKDELSILILRIT